ncbi:helix-turn-helix transcriptional regulator [Desemzia sp. FAM 24101]|uniref:helix-turn-helix transcriptional regulator n=1 Tax=unclassified Desemzia TaxID=2685243 RepID=UPI003885C54F
MNVNLKIARLKKQLTQKELAKRVGVTNKYLSQIENGVSNNPSNNLMIKLAKELDCTVQELFFEEVTQ